MGLRGMPAIAPESGGMSIVVCCLCLHGTFKKPGAALELDKKDGGELEDGKRLCYCKLTGAGRTVNPCAVRSCITFLPAPNQAQRNQALQQLGGAFSFVPRRAAC